MKHRISFCYEETGSVEIEANSVEEAKDKLELELDNSGTDNLEIKHTNREITILD